MKKNQDIYLGSIILIFSAVLWQQMIRIRGNAIILPRIFLVLMIISGFGIIISAIIRNIKTGQTYHKMSLKEFFWELGLPGLWLCIICFLFNILGFYLCSFLFIIEACLLQDFIINKKIPFSARYIGKLFLYSSGSTIFMFLCFRVLLKMHTPIGFFGF